MTKRQADALSARIEREYAQGATPYRPMGLHCDTNTKRWGVPLMRHFGGFVGMVYSVQEWEHNTWKRDSQETE